VKNLVLLACVFSTPPTAVWAQLAAGSEFQVNTYSTNAQYSPAVTSDANGNFVVVWTSLGQDGSQRGVSGQRFNAAGVPQGVEFQINSYTTSFQDSSVAASDAKGNFVVVWRSYGQDGESFGIFGQRFNASGVPQGIEFQVNSYATLGQYRPAVASDASGNFVVVWVSRPQDGSYYGVFGQRFSSFGARQGGEFQVNSYTTGRQATPSVASDAMGNFVVIWRSDEQDGSGYGVFGQRFSAAGLPQGSEFRVNSYTTGQQRVPAVASDASGNFVVVWASSADSDYGVFGQRFSAAGLPQGSEFRVNTYTTNGQFVPTVASDANGNFVVVWRGDGQDASSSGIFGQRFNATGIPEGSEFRVNSYTTNTQGFPSVSSDTEGDFVIVWQSNGQDGSGYGIFGQRYGDLIFEDGFESADLTRWSSVQTGGGDLSADGAAGMAGTSTGLQAVVNDTNSLFVQDDTPSAERRYRVRFYFDPNGFDPGETQSHFRTRILLSFDQSSLRAITLVLKRQVGAYSVEARVKRNDGTRADTGFFPITDAPHFLEFDWQQATGPGALNGSLELWIDGISIATLTGIDNDQSVIESVRMGALSVKTGAAGTLFFDLFESRRQVLIGPE
jgi:hypothetical protein